MNTGGTAWVLLGRQALAVLVTVAYSGAFTFAIAWLIEKTIGLRAAPEHELAGIDEAEHAETAYDHGRVGAHFAATSHAVPARRP